MSTLVCAMMVCAGIQGRGSRILRLGIYLFTVMEWVSAVGFSMFPLSDSGYAGTFQDRMHIYSTIVVVLLSIISLVLIIIAGIKDKEYRLYGAFAGIALGMMLVGAMGMNIVPKEYEIGKTTKTLNGVTYYFDGWYDNADLTGSAYTSDRLKNLASDVTLYAKWSPAQYKITYDLGLGST